jgi:hypothetical protein
MDELSAYLELSMALVPVDLLAKIVLKGRLKLSRPQLNLNSIKLMKLSSYLVKAELLIYFFLNVVQ